MLLILNYKAKNSKTAQSIGGSQCNLVQQLSIALPNIVVKVGYYFGECCRETCPDA